MKCPLHFDPSKYCEHEERETIRWVGMLTFMPLFPFKVALEVNVVVEVEIPLRP